MDTPAQLSKPKPQTFPYDVAVFLRTPEECAGYLDVWLEESPEDIQGICKAIGDVARAQGMSEVAREAGLNRESLYRALGENGNPSFATVMKVLATLGIRLRAELVSPNSPQEADSGTESLPREPL